MKAPHYDTTTIRLHWTTAILVAVLWAMGQTADWLPRGPLRLGSWSTHVVLGFALATILVWRIAWRARGGRTLPASDRGLLHGVAKATHYGLYLLLAAVVGLGVVNAFVRGFSIYGLFNLPQIGDREMREPITDWHGLAANLLLGLAAFHAAAALVHHYVWKDSLLERMIPNVSRPR